jgi:hypothetical protein
MVETSPTSLPRTTALKTRRHLAGQLASLDQPDADLGRGGPGFGQPLDGVVVGEGDGGEAHLGSQRHELGRRVRPVGGARMGVEIVTTWTVSNAPLARWPQRKCCSVELRRVVFLVGATLRLQGNGCLRSGERLVSGWRSAI